MNTYTYQSGYRKVFVVLAIVVLIMAIGIPVAYNYSKSLSFASSDKLTAQAQLLESQAVYNETLPEVYQARGKAFIDYATSAFIVILGIAFLILITPFSVNLSSRGLAKTVLILRGEYDRVPETSYIAKGVVARHLTERGYPVLGSGSNKDQIIVGGTTAGNGNKKQNDNRGASSQPTGNTENRKSGQSTTGVIGRKRFKGFKKGT